jgi:hypothetical protein
MTTGLPSAVITCNIWSLSMTRDVILAISMCYRIQALLLTLSTYLAALVNINSTFKCGIQSWHIELVLELTWVYLSTENMVFQHCYKGFFIFLQKIYNFWWEFGKSIISWSEDGERSWNTKISDQQTPHNVSVVDFRIYKKKGGGAWGGYGCQVKLGHFNSSVVCK